MAYRLLIDGVTVECDTPAELLALKQFVVAGHSRRPMADPGKPGAKPNPDSRRQIILSAMTREWKSLAQIAEETGQNRRDLQLTISNLINNDGVVEQRLHHSVKEYRLKMKEMEERPNAETESACDDYGETPDGAQVDESSPTTNGTLSL